VKIPKG